MVLHGLISCWGGMELSSLYIVHLSFLSFASFDSNDCRDQGSKIPQISAWLSGMLWYLLYNETEENFRLSNEILALEGMWT